MSGAGLGWVEWLLCTGFGGAELGAGLGECVCVYMYQFGSGNDFYGFVGVGLDLVRSENLTVGNQST